MATGVRLARTSDLDDVAAVQVDAWRASYAGVLPAEVLADLSPSDMALDWARALLLPGEHRLLVAMEDDRVVGAAALGPAADPDAAGLLEISLFVIAPDARGQGHGSRLMQACADFAIAAGHQELLTWIPLADEPLRRFLMSAGWGPDGAFRDLAVGPQEVLRQVRLGTLLVPPAG